MGVDNILTMFTFKSVSHAAARTLAVRAFLGEPGFGGGTTGSTPRPSAAFLGCPATPYSAACRVSMPKVSYRTTHHRPDTLGVKRHAHTGRGQKTVRHQECPEER